MPPPIAFSLFHSKSSDYRLCHASFCAIEAALHLHAFASPLSQQLRLVQLPVREPGALPRSIPESSSLT